MTLLLTLACTGPSQDSAPGEPDPVVESEPCDSEGETVEQPETDYLEEYNPVVVQTLPVANDQAVDPELSEIHVTFSKDMQDEAWSWVQVDNRTFPDTDGAEYIDARTNVLSVDLKPDHNYVIWINYDPTYMSFQDLNGNAAVPYLLTFRTRSE